MILISLFLLGLAAGVLRGGSLRNLAALGIRHAWVPLLAFGLQASLVLFPPRQVVLPSQLRSAVLLITYSGSIGFLLLNRALPGTRLLVLGTILNAAVMSANGGYMPVTTEALARSGHTAYVVAEGDDRFVGRSKDVVLDKADTRLWFLSDVFGIPRPAPFASNFSLGDLLIGFGAAWFTFQGLTRPRRRRAQASSSPVGFQPPISGSSFTTRRGSDHASEDDSHDDRQSGDRQAVSGTPVTESAGGHGGVSAFQPREGTDRLRGSRLAGGVLPEAARTPAGVPRRRAQSPGT